MAICVDVPGGYRPQPYRQFVPRSTSRRSIARRVSPGGHPTNGHSDLEQGQCGRRESEHTGRRSGLGQVPFPWSASFVKSALGSPGEPINNIKSRTTSGPSPSHIKRSIPSGTSRSSHTRCQHCRSRRLHQNVNRRVIQRSHTLQAGFFALLLVAGLTGARGFDNLI